MTWIEAALLGFIQGATEFLPVSSSGHLVIAQTLLDVREAGIIFEVAVHVATLVSILTVYRSRVAELLSGMVKRDAEAWRYAGLIVVATIPAGLLGVFAKDSIEALFENPFAPGIALLVTGVLLWSSRAAMARGEGTAEIAWRVAILVGVAQAFALVPGISRSGSTVVIALWLGIEAREAAAFSFLMAVPAIAGAAVLQLPDISATAGIDWGVLAIGSVVAAVTGVLAIRTFVALLAKKSFHYFAPYCWAVGGAFLVYLGLR